MICIFLFKMLTHFCKQTENQKEYLEHCFEGEFLIPAAVDFLELGNFVFFWLLRAFKVFLGLVKAEDYLQSQFPCAVYVVNKKLDFSLIHCRE